MGKLRVKQTNRQQQLPFILSLLRQGGTQNKPRPDADNMIWSGSASRDIGFGYSESSVTITMGEDGGAVSPEKKEVPIWMQKSTVEGVPLLDGGDSSVIFFFFFLLAVYVCLCIVAVLFLLRSPAMSLGITILGEIFA